LYEKTTLDNGLRVLSATMPHTRTVSIGIYLGVGSRYETEAEAGTSHFLEHLLFRGTERRPTARDISEAIEGVGGIFNAATDREMTVYWCKVARPHFELALDVLADMLLQSRLDPEDIKRESQIIIEEIHMSHDAPHQKAGMLIDELLWPEHPLGRDVAGSPECVKAVTRQSLQDYLGRYYLPANTVISIAGNISHRNAIDTVNRVLSDWTGRAAQPGYLPFTPGANPKLRIETRETEQAHLCLALPGLSITDPRRFTLDLLNIVLGEGMSSRLFTEIRDKLGLAYQISSYADHLLDTGSLTIYAGVETANLEFAIEAILEQLHLIIKPIPPQELTKAKEMTKGRLMLRMEDSRSVSGWGGGQEVLIGRILSVEEVIDMVEAVTAAEVQQLAGELFQSERLRLAVVGPVTADAPLERLLHF
jgi:predicted Zn-dependent peptidase